MIFESLRVRIFVVLACVLLAVAYLGPNFINTDKIWWPTKTKLNYGLDIQGGLHVVLGVDIQSVMQERVDRLAKSMKDDLSAKNISLASIEPTGEKKTEITLALSEAGKVPEFEKYLTDQYGSTLQVIEKNGANFRLKFYDAIAKQYQDQILQQAIEVIRNRIDEFGVAEPSISGQGSNRIVVQLPGIQNAATAKELINRTAHLEFRMVSDELNPQQLETLVSEAEKAGNYSLGKDSLGYSEYYKKINEDLKGKLPADTAVSFEKLDRAATLEVAKRPILVRTDTNISGDQIADAHVGLDERGTPVVQFRLNSRGSLRMGEVSGANIGKQLAIILDDVVQSAPTLQSRITDSGQITLGQRDYNASLNEANLISTALRAGALPAKLTQLEERTVGPTLGADAIRKGEVAGLIGFGLIIIFMAFYYRSLGWVANLALFTNLILLVAILTSLGATLTLPGVAGIVLTLGMAVDANVIIFERIKEELQKGSSPAGAVRDGFDQAFSAIFDSNVTSAVTAGILMYYGTGAVRGFAVTLLIGLVTSMFTAIFVSRTILEFMVHTMKMKNLTPVKVGGAS